MPYRGSGNSDAFESSMIVMWSGLLSNVPDGWSVCDGTNGTPDLRNKFVRGANVEVGLEGGCSIHGHCISGCTECEIGCMFLTDLGSIYPATFYGHLHPAGYLAGMDEPNIPPYYELIFIRKD